MTNYITSVGVQHFSITINSGGTTATATINAVGSGAFILFGGMNPSVASAANEAFAWITLTNSTTITATRNTGTAGSIIITGCIIDGTSNLITSVQYGTVTITGTTTGSSSISAVTNANTAIHLLGWSSSNTASTPSAENPRLSLSGTTVTATRDDTTGNLVVGFVVIEFNGSVLNQSVQNVAAVSTGNVSTYTATILSTVLNKSLVIYAGSSAPDAGNIARVLQYGRLTNTTTITAICSLASVLVKNYNCSVVEFVSGVLNSNMQRAITTLTAVASNTSTVSSVTKSNSALSWLGNSTDTTAASSLNISYGESVLTNNTTVTVSKNGATGNITGSWEVAEFVPYSIPGTTYADPLLFGMTF